jgi:WD40 repeat protein
VRAPNGVDTAYFYPIGSGVESILNDDLRYTPVFEGQTGVFSVNSDLIAVWSDQTLRIFTTASQEGFSTQSLYQSARLPVSYTAPSEDTLLTGAGAWSPNGRTFAFSTQSGVWLWDALTPDAQPARLLTADDEPIRVLHFSPLGNYLALETPARQYHVDIVALETYPDGLFSPDDRMMAEYDTRAAGLTPMRLYTMRPVFEPLTGWQNYTMDVSQVEWITSTNYIVAACGEAILDPEIPSGFDQPWCKVWSRAVGIYTGFGEYIDGTAFDYDPMTRSLAVLAGGDSITLNGETFNFAGQLNSDIAHIKVIPLIDLDYRHW